MSGDTTRRKLRIIGNSTAGGGYFSEATIVGDAVIEGDVDCITLKSVGNSRFEGNIRARSGKTVGSTLVTGSLNFDELHIVGNVDAKGNVKADRLTMRGGLDTRGSLNASELNSKGYLTVKKSCEAERFTFAGQLAVDGLLNAERVDIRVHGMCRVNEIGGDTIRINRGSAAKLKEMLKSLFLPADFLSGKLTADTIEGDEIHIEHTKAKVVRGKNIHIGQGCVIDLVEYKESCHTDKKSSVKMERKIK